MEPDVRVQVKASAGRWTPIEQSPGNSSAVEARDVTASAAEVFHKISLQIKVEAVIAAPKVAILAGICYDLHNVRTL